MNTKSENTILKVIKYGPISLILLFSMVLSLTLYINNQNSFEKEKQLIEKEYIQRNKELVKSQVDRVQNYIKKKQDSTQKKLKQSLKEKVYEAHKIISNIYEENKNLDKVLLEKLLKDALRPIKFNNNRGYFFIYTLDGKNILNSGFPSIEGKDLWKYQDGKGTFIIQEMNQILKTKNETFYTWYWKKPYVAEYKQFKKIGFFKLFEPFNWFIGTGEYFLDFEKDIKKDVLNYISDLTFHENSYIFVLDFEGNYLSHVKKEIVGLNAFDAQDIVDYDTILSGLEIARNNGSGYLTYTQKKKPGTNQATVKTSYLKGFQAWHWLIGKGFYEDEINSVIEKQKKVIEHEFKNNIKQIFIINTFLTILLLILSIKITNILQKRFEKYQEEITKQHNIMAHQSKMAAMGEMIANIAHQWRQPLSMITSLTTSILVKKSIEKLSDEDLEKNLNQINDSTKYLSKTIDDFRNFFSKNRKESIFSIKSAFEETFNIIEAQYKQKDISIIKNIEDFELKGVKSELVQVLINIFNNSKDELKKLENQKRFIFIDCYKKGDDLIVKIKDNAKGIPNEILDHVFEPYFTTKHQSQGTGIGLFMSQEIIIKHFRGSIKIENIKYTYEEETYKGAITTIKFNIP